MAALTWTEFCKQYAKGHGLTYGQSLTEAGPAWKVYVKSMQAAGNFNKKKGVSKDDSTTSGTDSSGDEQEKPEKVKPLSTAKKLPNPIPKAKRTGVPRSGWSTMGDDNDDFYEEVTTIVRKKRMRDESTGPPHRKVARERKRPKKDPKPPAAFSKEADEMIKKFPPKEKEPAEMEVGQATQEEEEPVRFGKDGHRGGDF